MQLEFSSSSSSSSSSITTATAETTTTTKLEKIEVNPPKKIAFSIQLFFKILEILTLLQQRNIMLIRNVQI
jgi:hypothetical protein